MIIIKDRAMKKLYKKFTLSGAALLSAVLLAGCGQAKDVEPSIKNQPAPSAPTESAPADNMEMKKDDVMEDTGAMKKDSVSQYSDGTYAADGNYTAPPGAEKIKVSVTLEEGIITAVTVTPTATDPVSKKLQNAFASEISTVVVGRTLDDADVNIVAGASLTAGGFNAALEKIRAQA